MSERDKWLQGLQSLLDKVLTPIISDTEMRKKFLTPDMMKIWATAFTHETVSPTDNYEELEYVGDGLLKAIFPKYLRKEFPCFNKADYTELNTAYMSKMVQAQLAKKLGLTEYILVKGIDKAILNLETDVFESFIGALDTVADIITDDKGFKYCYSMIHHLFEDIVIDEEKIKGSAKTQVIQMFVRFDLPKPKEISSGYTVSVESTELFKSFLRSKGINKNILGKSSSSSEEDSENATYSHVINLLHENKLITIHKEKIIKNSDKVDFTVELTKEHLNFINTLGAVPRDGTAKDAIPIVITNPVIGYAEAATKKEASYKAYENALKTLRSHNVNLKNVRNGKRIMDMLLDSIVFPYTKAAYERLEKEGYVDMYFFIPRKLVTPKGAVIELVGIKHENNREREVALAYIHAKDRDNGHSYAKAKLLEMYGSHQI